MFGIHKLRTRKYLCTVHMKHEQKSIIATSLCVTGKLLSLHFIILFFYNSIWSSKNQFITEDLGTLYLSPRLFLNSTLYPYYLFISLYTSKITTYYQNDVIIISVLITMFQWLTFYFLYAKPLIIEIGKTLVWLHC